MIEHAAFTTSPRRPVRWFVGVTLGVAALLVLVWWSALVSPRLQAVGASVTFEGAGGVATLFVENEGRFPVEILSAAPFGREVASGSLRAPVRVVGGAQAEVLLDLVLRCDPGVGPPSGVRLTVRTWLGVHRSIDVTDTVVDDC